MSPAPQAQVIAAPSRAPPRDPGRASVFLAGTTTISSSSSSSSSSPADGDWRAALCARLAHRPVTLYDPRRPDWDASWVEDPAACAPFAEQTAWELARAAHTDLVVFYFGSATDAPVSLLELGLAVGRRCGPGGGGGGGGVVVCADPAYRKRGNVQMVCQTYGVELVDGFDALADAVGRALDGLRR